jgi:hypothetical protein
MTKVEGMKGKKVDLKARLRNGLLLAQILLPFAGFIALQGGRGLWAGVIAALFALSMLVLVVLG